MTATLLRLHRWIGLLFALPLAVVIVTGGILSIEPILNDRLMTGRSIALPAVQATLAKHDPDKKATAINFRAYENTAILLFGGGAPVRVDLASANSIGSDVSLWSDFMLKSRRMHEHLLLDLKWLVIASTIAMLVAMMFGLFMGLPWFRNSLGGWHRTIAWGLSPLLILTALSGLAIAYGWTFTGPPPAPPPPPARVSLHEAVGIVAKSHDLASVIWIRPAGGALRTRLHAGREVNVFLVTRDGLVPGPRNWPRLLHEGVWAGAYSGLLNLVISIALSALMATGLTIWARRTLRLRANRARAA